MSISFRCALAALVSVAINACDNGPTAPGAGPVLEVAVSTTGGDPDTGYDVVVGTLRRQIGPSGTTRFNVQHELYTLELQGVAENCIVAGSAQRPVDMRRSDNIKVVFEVDCASTGLEIRTHTEGVDLPESFTLVITGAATAQIGVNNSMTVTRLHPAAYTVELRTPNNNCSSSGPSSTVVDVKNRTVTRLDFYQVCSTIPRPEMIAYANYRPFSAGPLLEMVSPDGLTTRRLVDGLDPTWSPDGKRLAYSNVQCTEHYYYYYSPVCVGGIAVIDPETLSFRQLAGGELGVQPAWSPKGDRIAFAKSDGSRFDLYLLTLDGQRTRMIFDDLLSAWSPEWSPDASRIVFVCGLIAGRTDICTVRPDRSELAQLTTGNDNNDDPSWSPDGRTIAFTRTPPGGPTQVAIVEATGGRAANLTPGWDPSWSQDGSRIVFSRVDGLYTMNPDGSDVIRLTTGPHFGGVWRTTQ